MMLKYRVHEVARDLNVKSKEVSDLLLENFGRSKKHMTSLTEEELNFIFEYYTQKNSVENFNNYFSQQRKVSDVQKEKLAKKLKETNKPKDKKTATSSVSKSVIKNKPSSFISKSDIKSSLQKFDFTPTKQKVVVSDKVILPKKASPIRVINIRTSNVNIDRYNEKYDKIASERIKFDTSATGKQKIYNNNRFMGKYKPRRGKRETEVERLKRIASERKAKPITVLIPDEITVSELALRLKVTVAEVIKKLMAIDVMVSANNTIDFDTASLIAMEFHAKVEKEVFVTIEEQIIDSSEDDDKNLIDRAPVVVVMGHVDHGKTSLLDSIRKENVVSLEEGGITQHIGAYKVKTPGGYVTFIDTPGHEAFTAMRARGAKVTDIGVLVVAADDGIMPQTIEAINHAKAAEIPIIVAINKIDKEGVNPERIKQQLSEHELIPEDWGGNVPCVEVSAKKNKNISLLLDNILLMAQIKELRANPDRAAKGTVIEAKINKGLGPITSVLVQNGTLKIGDIVVAGSSVGKVRTMINDRGVKVKEAKPSDPIEIIGFDNIPNAGDVLNAVSNERLAKELVRQRKDRKKAERFAFKEGITVENLFDQIEASDIKELKIIVKADVGGSVEALKQSLTNLGNKKTKVNVIHSAVGTISESDVMLASASNAMVIGFNVKSDSIAEKTAKITEVDLKLYTVIYDCIKDIENILKGMIKSETRQTVIGRAECRHLYKISGIGLIAGSYVLDGKIKRNSEVKVIRDNTTIAQDRIVSLKRFKEDAKDVNKGYECGIRLEHFNDLKKGDILEAFSIEELDAN